MSTALETYIERLEETLFCYKCYRRDGKKVQSKNLRKLMMECEKYRKPAKQELLEADAKTKGKSKKTKNEESSDSD